MFPLGLVEESGKGASNLVGYGEKRRNNACEESGQRTNRVAGFEVGLADKFFVLTTSTPVDCLGVLFRRYSLYSLA